MTLLGLQGPVHTWGLLQPELSHMCLQLELSHVRFMKLSNHFSAAMDKQGGRAPGAATAARACTPGGPPRAWGTDV